MTDRGPLRPSELADGESLLVVGPPMTDKRGLVGEVVAATPDRSGVFVTTKKNAASLREAFDWWTDGYDLSVVDCSGSGESSTRGSVRYVTTPADLTGVGIATLGAMHDRWVADTRRVRVGLHSLTTVLMYADLRRVYQFLHVLTSRIDRSGFAGAFAYTTTGDAESLARLTPLFDGVVETRKTDGGSRELRGRGTAAAPDEWTEY